MTSGTKVHGQSIPVSTSAGAGTIRIDNGTRSWSGGNSPSAKPVRYQRERENVYVKIRVRAGKEVITVTRKKKFYWVKDKPPKRARALLPLAYSMTDQFWNDRVFEYSSYPPTTWQTCTGWNSGFATAIGFTDPWTSNDDIALLGKLRERVAGSSFNAGVFLAESKPALEMIADSANRIYRGYKAARKGNFVEAARQLTIGTPREKLGRQVSANNWLQLQYGWLPLLSDCHDGAQFLAHHLNWPLQFRVRVSRFRALVPKPSNYGTSMFAESSIRRKTIIAYISEKDVAKLSGLTDPLSIAWELVPYSFVVDWFIPIGNYLAARGLSSSLQGLFVTSDKKYEEWQGIFTSASSPYPRSFRNGNSGIGMKKISFTRSVSSSLSVPLPSVKPLGQVPSWIRAANSIALLSQLKK